MTAVDVKPNLIEVFSEWQIETMKKPEVAALKGAFKQRLWVEPGAFELVLPHDNECFDDYLGSYDEEYPEDQAEIKTLRFFKEACDFQAIDVFTEQDLMRSAARRIWNTFFDTERPKGADPDDIIFFVTTAMQRESIKFAIEDRSKPLNQHLFDEPMVGVSEGLKKGFKTWQKAISKDVQKREKKMRDKEEKAKEEKVKEKEKEKAKDSPKPDKKKK